MNIAILTIGDEVVSGKITNTNASHIAKVLEANQFIVSRHLSVRDLEVEIISGLDYLYQNADVVITTGGLGPTSDDLTKEVSAAYFNEEMILYPEELTKIENYFTSSGRVMPEINKKQAYFIPEAIVIRNDNGTAPGMIYEKKQRIIINLPGPPKELEPMLEETVIPYLKKKFLRKIFKKEYRLMGLGESDAETIIKPLFSKYPKIKISPYASVGIVDYLITTTEDNDELFIACCRDFEQYLADYIIGDWKLNIQDLIVSMLTEKGLKLTLAESCTGGMVTSSIVNVSGSSKVLTEAMVTYSNEAKVKHLGVKEETLSLHGAVSAEVAAEMAKGVKEVSGADIGLSITGIAGPTGGTEEKPVGLVYSGIYFNGDTYVFKNIYKGDRYKVRYRATLGILYELYKILKKTL